MRLLATELGYTSCDEHQLGYLAMMQGALKSVNQHVEIGGLGYIRNFVNVAFSELGERCYKDMGCY